MIKFIYQKNDHITIQELTNWLEKNCNSKWIRERKFYRNRIVFWFWEEEDIMAFKLRWL